MTAAPVELWAHFTQMRRILCAHEELTGCLHPGAMLPPAGVLLEDDADVAAFFYPEVTYRFDRELEVLFELRPGMIAAYTSRGTVAFVTQTSAGVRPLLDCPDREPPTPSRN